MVQDIFNLVRSIPNLSIERHKGYICAHWGDELSPSFVIWDKEGKEVEGGSLDMCMFPFKEWVDAQGE